ncbi:toxin-antitoxin system, toxin component [Burkholderia cepacia]|uniref:Toxin-antitoxin system, toxin component n=1 Tax=Burkholderia cepacia TaxID=292 RepID=A0AAX2RKP4_BURCE|nr:toxin-antitoxin system, toxin component [Burkholderia cepacia]TES97629.1 toxin-antitoxin system, toxin component [Burkholderia cepacia]TEU37793.1 toxin-antitoxin system, toxin component [Burkholderia cepacia]TEU41815.1 toxin-antitoxin system, toxin component [Burkholderia cepacia]TEU49422.1 toxin-antitoxin system, toxin component [Burkholderia cepacia]
MVSLMTSFDAASVWKILELMRREPANVRFNDQVRQVLDAIDRLKEQKSRLKTTLRTA